MKKPFKDGHIQYNRMMKLLLIFISNDQTLGFVIYLFPPAQNKEKYNKKYIIQITMKQNLINLIEKTQVYIGK
ncbi:hypothetical protein pb186bvf_021028 [Paramecium bursaria]